MKDAGVKIDHVLEIAVPDEEIVNRLAGRRVHPASGRIYHVDLNPPREEGKDDVTGEPLIQRDDDSEARCATGCLCITTRRRRWSSTIRTGRGRNPTWRPATIASRAWVASMTSPPR